MSEEVVNETVKKVGRPSNARERILESTLQLMQERGIAGLGVEAIMERAGVGKGSFYHFFRSKEGLLESAIEELIRRVKGDLNAHVFLPGVDPLETPLRLLQHLGKEPFSKRGPLWLVSECAASDEIPPGARRHISSLFQFIRERLEACFLQSITEHELLPHAPVKELAEACV
ncbi:MAG: TetR/AcrR family transcriptional regulator, partial [Fimbriimonadales bacterium]|nr:TetR/AcrR family transcriptional regulator [Fimbriimonadales bacterium]